MAQYIYVGGIDSIKTRDSKEINIAKHILAETGLYGDRKRESISHEFSQAVIGYWIFHQVLGMEPGEYVAGKIRLNDYPSYFTVISLKHILVLNQIVNDGLLTYQDIPTDRWGEFNSMWYLYLEKELPMLKWQKKILIKFHLEVRLLPISMQGLHC